MISHINVIFLLWSFFFTGFTETLIYLNYSCHIWMSIYVLIICLEIQLWPQRMNLNILITWCAAGLWYASTTTCIPAPFYPTQEACQSYLHCSLVPYSNYCCSRQAALAVSVAISVLRGVDRPSATCEAVQGGRLDRVDFVVELYRWQHASYWAEEDQREQL